MFEPIANVRYALHYTGNEGTIFVTVYDADRQIKVYEDYVTLAWYTRIFRAANVVRITNRVNGEYAAIVEKGLRDFANEKGATYANMGG